MRRGFIAAAVGLVALCAVSAASAVLGGTWDAYPGQGASYEVGVQQPINADGSSNFKANGKAVVPIKFSLKQGPGPFVFESHGPLPDTTFSFVRFTPSAPLTWSQITNLSAAYDFTAGNCQGGSLRWSVRVNVQDDADPSNDPAVFIYYGDHPNFTSCDGASSQSGHNMVGAPANADLRYDTSQLGGTFYDSYAGAGTLAGAHAISRVSLVLDSGWVSTQEVDLTSATVNDNTFTPAPTQALQPTCDLPTDAEIVITKTAGTASGPVNEPVSIQPADDNGIFRVVDCKLMYNLATSSLSGVGTYKVEVKIDGVLAGGNATFDLK